MRALRCPTLLRAAAALIALCCGIAGAADFRDPAEQPFVIWPNIPVVRAADLAEYADDRDTFANLHHDKADPEKVIAALQAVDALQAHHERMALAQFGRSLSAQLIGEMDRQARDANTRAPKVRFDFAGITPEELQRPSAQDARARAALQARAGQVTIAAYITYTRLEGSFIQATATLVKLASGASQSFTVTGPATGVGEMLARDLFNYFYGTRFSEHRNPLADREWLTAAPGHTDQLVSQDAAARYCRTQNASLPTAEELEIGEALGVYSGGVALRPASVYHLVSGMYESSQTQAGAGKVRPNYITSVSNGYYFCIRRKAVARR